MGYRQRGKVPANRLGLLELAEATPSLETRAAMLDLAQQWLELADQSERNERYRVSGYRAKAYECTLLAESTNNPERRSTAVEGWDAPV